jgi:outer membrane protein TolC
MKVSIPSSRSKLALSAIAIVALSGCASASLEENVTRVNDEARSFTDGNLSLARTSDERVKRANVAQSLLGSPVGQREAVQLALVNSPSLQTLLAQGWAASADAAQTGRISNPIVSFERMVNGAELELGRALSFGLLDVLTLPARQGIASLRIEQSQLRLTSEVIDQVTKVRQAWVRAVTAEQTFQYAQQVFASAEASSELARRMQSVGNFNRLRRAREQAFYADAATRLATASHQVTATREELVRFLGLDEAQAQALTLPKRLC